MHDDNIFSRRIGCHRVKLVLDYCWKAASDCFIWPAPSGVSTDCVLTDYAPVPGGMVIKGPVVTPVGGGQAAVAAEVVIDYLFRLRCGSTVLTTTHELCFPVIVYVNDPDPRTARVQVTAEPGQAAFVLLPLPAGLPGGEFRVVPVQRYTGAEGGEQLGFAACVASKSVPAPARLAPVRSAGRRRLQGYVLAGAPSSCPGGLAETGSVLVYSPDSAIPLLRCDGRFPPEDLGFTVAAAGGPVGDSIPGFLAGSPSAALHGLHPNAGSAYALSGEDCHISLRLDGERAWDQFAWAVSSAGDVDGDGVPDILVGAPSTDPAGRRDAGSVYLYSGRDGRLLHRWDGEVAGVAFGYAVMGGVDLDGDGVPDIVAGAPWASPGGRQEAGSVYAFSGADGHLLFRSDGVSPGDGFGFSLAHTGGAHPDLIIGAPSASPGSRKEAGSVFVCSGRTGVAITRVDGPETGGEMGTSVAGGLTSPAGLAGPASYFAAGAPWASPGGRHWAGSVFLFRTHDGALVQRLDGGTEGEEFGWSLGTGASSGRSPAMLIVGAPSAGSHVLDTAGAAVLYSTPAGAAAIAGTASVTMTVQVTQETHLLIPEVGEVHPRNCQS